MVQLPLTRSYHKPKRTQCFSHHKRQQTLLLQVYCVKAEQRYSTGSLQTACQWKEVLQGLTQDGTCLRPPRWRHVNYQHPWGLIGEGRRTAHLAGGNTWPVSATHATESAGKQRSPILIFKNHCQLLHFSNKKQVLEPVLFKISLNLGAS